MTKYHPALVILHWLLAAMVIGGLIMGGFVLAATPNDDPFKMTSLTMHMSMGMLILFLMVVRLIVRLSTTKPPHADSGIALMNTAAKLGHWGLYVLVFAMSASGLALANMADLPAIVFGGSGEPLPEDFSAYPPRAAHGMIATLLGLLVLGHIAAALYHQFVRKDGLFARMWFGDRQA